MKIEREIVLPLFAATKFTAFVNIRHHTAAIEVASDEISSLPLPHFTKPIFENARISTSCGIVGLLAAGRNWQLNVLNV